jgi:hypothetical protein
MSNHLDEDLIEATIRRVAEAKAAREASGAPDAAEPAPPEEPERDAPAPDIDEDRIAETIRRVEAAKAAMMAAATHAEEPAQHEPGPADEEEPAPAPVVAEEELAPHEEVRRSARRAAALLIEPAEQDDDAPRAIEPPAAISNDAVVDALARIESGVQESNAMMRAMIARIESLMPLLEKIGGAPPAPPPLFAVRSGTDASAEPAPRLSRSAPPPVRPAVFRDLPADSPPDDPAEPAPEEIDRRPLPEPLPPIHAAESRRGLDLLPRGYRITVEDKRRGVDLVPLHRALLGMDGVRDMSLLSYNNGIAIVSLDTVNDLAPDDLEAAVSRAMARPARVEVHNEHTMVVKLED